MAVLEDVKGIVKETLGEIAKRGEYSPADFEIMHHATGIIKDIKEICGDMDGYSGGRNMRYYDGNQMYRPRYNEYSGNRNVIGRYSSGGSYSGGNMYSGGSYSGTAYSGTDDTSAHMVEKLEAMLNEACTDEEREAIKNCINKLSW